MTLAEREYVLELARAHIDLARMKTSVGTERTLKRVERSLAFPVKYDNCSLRASLLLSTWRHRVIG